MCRDKDKGREERRGGELLGEQTIKGGERHKLHDGTYGRKSTLPEGITKTQSHRWQQIANIPEETFEEHIAIIKNSGKGV